VVVFVDHVHVVVVVVIMKKMFVVYVFVHD
jgi:hypothetical protein